MCAATGGGGAPRPRPRAAAFTGGRTFTGWRSFTSRRSAGTGGRITLRRRRAAAANRSRRRRRRSRHRTVAAPAPDGGVEHAVDEVQAPVARERRHEFGRRQQLRFARWRDRRHAGVRPPPACRWCSSLLSITGVAVDVLVQIQFGGASGIDGVVERAPPDRRAGRRVERRQRIRGRERIDDGFQSLRSPDALRHERRREHRVARLDLDRHFLVDLCFPFQREPSDGLLRQRGLTAVPSGPLDIASPRQPFTGSAALCLHRPGNAAEAEDQHKAGCAHHRHVVLEKEQNRRLGG